MADYYTIAIIGSGNVAWHLAPELENCGHSVVEIHSRSKKNAKLLQNRLFNADINPSLDFSKSEAEVFMLCVSDDAIQHVTQEIALPNDAILVHISGSQSIQSLGYAATEHIGVFYPLQTFTKSKKTSFANIPILIESENKHTAKVLNNLGMSISKKVIRVSSKDRMGIHVAAVFACNFTNHLFEIAENMLTNRGFEFELLKPLIAETINKGLEIGPENAQTGPAARGDMEVLYKHMKFLEKSEYQELYKMITDKIMNR